MKLTAEQHAIINSKGDIKINAVAGSGKTTTIIEYAKTRPKSAKILYLAFNKSVKLEAAKKFAAKGLRHVTVETAHSLAYKNIVLRHQYKVRPQGYKTHELAELLGLQGNGEKHHEYVIANHINKFIALFCNSDKLKVQDVNYLETVGDAKAKTFVKTFYHFIETQTRSLLAKMDNGEIEITHDFYLKKFQLQNPVLPFDYILFDEGQDASPAMLDIFLKQAATKVIVGDTHQQIYSWRYAVNSLEKSVLAGFDLSNSFRFSANIASLATKVLSWKNEIAETQPVSIKGLGNSKETKTKAVIGRTNLGLLLKAIEYVTEKKNIQQIYFEGNINSYTYADEGASLYDVLNLHNNRHHLIKDALIKSMGCIKDLEEYIEKTEDAQLGMMLEIVKKYGNDIYDIIKKIKEKHVTNDDKEKAEIVFSTVHRCKGMEYDAVHLVNDFITESKVERQAHDFEKDEKKMSKLNEEINLLYVAVTRTKNTLHIPEELLPKDFPKQEQIIIIKKEEPKEIKPVVMESFNPKYGYSKYTGTKRKTYAVELIRTKYGEAYKPWTPEQDEKLTQMFNNNHSDTEIIKHFGRNAGAIRSRLNKLGLK
ncbi:MAG: UvrD-helicase domain-containing protein [Ferruginibacter sp.]|nr:ATP-dependent helicase [Chitinophagaceae bacterium]